MIIPKWVREERPLTRPSLLSSSSAHPIPSPPLPPCPTQRRLSERPSGPQSPTSLLPSSAPRPRLPPPTSERPLFPPTLVPHLSRPLPPNPLPLALPRLLQRLPREPPLHATAHPRLPPRSPWPGQTQNRMQTMKPKTSVLRLPIVCSRYSPFALPSFIR